MKLRLRISSRSLRRSLGLPPRRIGILHVDEIVAAHRQPHRRTGWRLGSHLMPGHGRGIEDIALNRMEFTGILELAADGADLDDPPFGGAGMHMTKGRMRVERPLRRSRPAAADIA